MERDFDVVTERLTSPPLLRPPIDHAASRRTTSTAPRL
jgi:hypothetical protein